MLISMTAYACTELTENDLTVTVEIRSYNSRNLDVLLRLPPGYAGLEDRIKGAIAARVARGRVEVRIKVRDLSAAASAYEADLARAKAYFEAARDLKAALGLAGEPTLDHLLALPGLIQPVENAQLADTHWPLLERCLDLALETLDQMRRQEGGHLGQDFAQRLDWIETQLAAIENATDGLLAAYREKLQSRIETLTQGLVTLDPMRIAQEAALMADRSDISEEIVRARSHIVQFRDTIQDGEPSGRKLNFLLQEFNREFNTMGAKVGQAALSHLIVAVKAEIEKLREQVQNIE